jgi:glucokinase
VSPVPVLEVGGSHVTAALLEPSGWRYAAGPLRRDIDSHAGADELIGSFAVTARALDVGAGRDWGVAMPDPFDYLHGIGRFHDVGKFEALDGVNVGAALRAALDTACVRFVNDADAFTLGEAAHGAGAGLSRVAGLTLGTGVGSGWVVNGKVAASGPGIPPGGRIHQLRVGDAPLEDVMSRRALRAAYRAAAGADLDVHEIADLARGGDRVAIQVLRPALAALGAVVGACLRGFRADVLVVGGSMAASWDLFGPWFAEGAGPLRAPVRVSADAEHAGLIGAALTSSG